MSKKLVIVESPAKAKTIGKILGKDYIIRASMGHIRDLPERSFGVDIEHGFVPQYEENKSRSKNLSELKTAAKAAEEIYLASDPDREGEAIAWHLQEVLSNLNKTVPFHRVSFHEITRSAIERAFKQPGSVDMNLVDAQQARRVLDRIVGYQISPLLWTRIERGVSAGRVQSVALRLVCEREREIQSFIPQEYWNFTARFSPEDNGNTFLAKLTKIDGKKLEINNGTDAGRVLDAVRGAAAWKITSIDVQPRKKNAPPPFITSTLQQAASSALGFSASQTMRIAQQLYEGIDTGNGPIGLITYMRTDSVAVAVEAQNACRKFIADNYGVSYVPEKPNFYRSKVTAQGAHEAIRPTDVRITPESLKSVLDSQQLRLYTIIWRRFVACQMSPARQERTTVIVEGKGSDRQNYEFHATATVTKFPGFLQAYNIEEEGVRNEDDEENRDAAILGTLKQNQNCTLTDSLSEQKFTEPAPRYSEATLIKELETNGIGRPSTYATIVNTIQVRHYVEKEKGKLIPTDLGFRINDYLVTSLPELFQVGFTAVMEDQLDGVEEGKYQWTAMLTEFYKKFSAWLKQAKNEGAPESGKAKALLDLLSFVKEWEKADRIPGKRVFNEEKFLHSVQAKYEKEGMISAKQWEAVLALALKYRAQLPALAEVAEKNGFTDDLKDAEERRRERLAALEERRAHMKEIAANAPPQDGFGQIFAALDAVKWQNPEKRRGREYDDAKFFKSLKDQFSAGKALTEKQIAALGKILTKYESQIPNCKDLQSIAGLRQENQAASEDAAKQKEDVSALLASFDKVQNWAEPVKRGRRVFDDKEFVESIRKQSAQGKQLSEKQIAALKKMAAKYSL